MRLLHTSTYRVHSFHGTNIPPYVILSHAWGEDEITFDDIQDSLELAKQRNGFSKVAGTCREARSNGFDYVWIDTCCIDKRNSTELSEAINSMYRWYENAAVCYAYLQDIEKCKNLNHLCEEHWTTSRWFKRGWTLQELIAPFSVIFFDRRWREIGTKSSLREDLAKLTRVPESVLSKLEDHRSRSISIAQKMSWAADRETSRTEDIAYALLGIFDVNMPMIYGEGEKAFLRLQHEIIKNVSDQSIFAWRPTHIGPMSVFAKSPRAFKYTGHIRPPPLTHHGGGSSSRLDQWPLGSSEFFLTNKGLRISLLVKEVEGRGQLACLNCIAYANQASNIPDQALDQAFAFPIEYSRFEPQQVVRTGDVRFLERSDVTSSSFKLKELYLQHNSPDQHRSVGRVDGNFQVHVSSTQDFGFAVCEVWPASLTFNSYHHSDGALVCSTAGDLRVFSHMWRRGLPMPMPMFACCLFSPQSTTCLVVLIGLHMGCVRLEMLVPRAETAPQSIETMIEDASKNHHDGLYGVFGRASDRVERPIDGGILLSASLKVQKVDAKLTNVVTIDLSAR